MGRTGARGGAAGASHPARSRLFSRYRAKAREYADDPERMRALARNATVKLSQLGDGAPSPIRAVSDQIKTLIRLVRAYAKGEYRDISRGQLVLVIAGLIYFVSPADLLPDFLPTGLLDDAAVVAWVLRTLHEELGRFRAWEDEQAGRPVVLPKRDE